MHATLPLLEVSDFPALHRQVLTTLQVNLGYRCNQSCVHCHVNAGPNRKEMMDEATMALIPAVLSARDIQTLDLTGGAPELHVGFRSLVRAARELGVHVIDRCNLTILFEPGHEDLAEFLAANRVEVVASLPCYSADNVDKQRGNGVFDKSIAALQKLNALGYGQPGSGLTLNLVYNPQGPSLPPDQATLEATYKRELFEHFGIVFNQLFALANMPINRFGSWLISKGQFNAYMGLLKSSHRSENLAQVMCRSLVSVDWQGHLFDCDFNQQLGLSLQGSRVHLRDLLQEDLQGAPIRVADHCFACTAGCGSSCGGALKQGERP
ncbi:arsenosugar biosynthesis radical SAM (seleno)protein ArsS [Chitinivorax sp. PXF-14]|uniref:Arsenosugar biosynthesis radical SAM protein ArsS n=1 Tax=Burkholderia cepacia TaxID=292 RepID=A0A8I1AJZ0_BURCE|nr:MULTISPECIES: arsenosugar biosynthesis radical SAM (seleno)protein ArsS [Burkholderiaceae]MBB0025153.1 radical SAM/Cys-rich domain protein [Ralstonia pickettii]MBB0035941.1 radical SAM/Cys-rich domain protein [Ralstonia pickettii]MBB0098481.1 radical SAM/Cys-rich domain protein [Ralstonia pickettii]MBB0108460.1 radical SAM/Cys-rich domain protein [Ralstonia pickettii]MBB0129255.1 radical SAM/Cys-rich domain protein [Ralstonia pickettii]